MSTTDWATISSLATAGGTLVLGVATFASVRSANRSARVAEQVLMIQTRPVLATSRLQDEAIKITWGDEHWTKIPGGCGVPEIVDGIVYLSMSLRNVGAGIAVIQGWHPQGAGLAPSTRPVPVDQFRPQSRDLFVAAGDLSFWQGAIREPDDPHRELVTEAILTRQRFTIDILYSDHNGTQRAVTRFGLFPMGGEDQRWLASTARHWNLDRADPR